MATMETIHSEKGDTVLPLEVPRTPNTTVPARQRKESTSSYTSAVSWSGYNQAIARRLSTQGKSGGGNDPDSSDVRPIEASIPFQLASFDTFPYMRHRRHIGYDLLTLLIRIQNVGDRRNDKVIYTESYVHGENEPQGCHACDVSQNEAHFAEKSNFLEV
jgi:hypothetical protein